MDLDAVQFLSSHNLSPLGPLGGEGAAEANSDSEANEANLPARHNLTRRLREQNTMISSLPVL